MKQLSLPGMVTQKIVNISSVKHRSPFRYPGGKTWLVPRIFSWLNSKDGKVENFIEPFAGGAIVGLSVAFEELANHVTLIECDEQVSAVWQTIIQDANALWLAEQIKSFDLTPENVNSLLNKQTRSTKDLAFQTIVKNRVNRGGILANGAGKLKNGENGKGILSRWYPDTLAKRIQDINDINERFTFIDGDGIKIIEEHSKNSDVVFFIDPPYTASSKRPGKRLYNYSEIDHDKLFALLARVKGDFLMTYDNVEEVQNLARQHKFDFLAVPMKNTHHERLDELLIGRDLDWLRD